MPPTDTLWLKQMGEWIGSEPASEIQLTSLAEDGLPTGVVKILMDHGLSTTEVYSIVIPQRTLKHRKSRQERLSRDESDRAIRAARVLAHAQNVMGGEREALQWMRETKQRFNGRTPFEMLQTEAGGRLVEEMLIQIDEGMFA
jgi:putative toxin-antitoxin system antitoxin component (TIGR02293 family)